MERNKGKIITVTSTKGGVGKTITTLNLAGVFSNLKKKVLVIDFDLYGGAVATYLNSKNDKTIFNLITDLSNNKYKNIIDEIEDKIKNKEDLDFVKEKFTELSVFFIDIIDKLTSITNARLNEIEESQREIDNKISKVQSVVNNIENDIYADDENCEFEIICPYCNYQFVTDIDSEINEEVECPECHNVIELDWNEGECSHECSDCKSNCVREDGEEYNQDKKDNEEDNM